MRPPLSSAARLPGRRAGGRALPAPLALLVALAACGEEPPRTFEAPAAADPAPSGPERTVQDGASLAQALSDATGPLRIRLEAGRYGLDALPPLVGTGIELVGAGPDATELTGGLRLDGCTGCRLTDLTLQGPGPLLLARGGSVSVEDVRLIGSAPSDTAAVVVRSGSVELEGVLVDGFAVGVALSDSARAQVRHSVLGTTRAGVHLGGGAGAIVVDNLFRGEGCPVWRDEDAFPGDDASGFMLLGNLTSGEATAFSPACLGTDALRWDDPDAVPVRLELERIPALTPALAPR
ncbi:MAG: hypothetical protein R3E98_15705 [Gemmatimonadota bacterium]